MKKILNGLVYDTAKATMIGSGSSGGSGDDFRHFDESLYRTEAGRYFLSGEGGAMTRWARTYGDSTCGSAGIVAFDESEALEWCEAHDVDADVIAQYFPVKAA